MINFVKLAVVSILVSALLVNCMEIQKRDVSNLPRPDFSNFPRNNPNFPRNNPNFPSNNPNFPRPNFPTNGGSNNFHNINDVLDSLPDMDTIMKRMENNPNINATNYKDIMNAILKVPEYQEFLKQLNPQRPNDVNLVDLDKLLNRISNKGGFQNNPPVLASDSGVAIGSVVMVTIMSVFVML